MTELTRRQSLTGREGETVELSRLYLLLVHGLDAGEWGGAFLPNRSNCITRPPITATSFLLARGTAGSRRMSTNTNSTPAGAVPPSACVTP